MHLGPTLKSLALAATLIISPFWMSQSGAQSAFEDPGVSVGATGATGNGLIAVQPVMDGGAVIVGSTAQVVALFRNDGAKPVNVGAVNLYPSSGISATVALNQCAQEELPSGAVCAIALSIKGLQPGNYRLEMLINHDGRSKLLSAVVSGGVESTGDALGDLVSDIEAIPAEIDFQTVSSSRSQVRSIVLRNVTSKKVDINEMFIEASAQSGFTLNTDCTVLEAGQACLASVSWTPAQEGADSGVLVIRHDGPSGITSVAIDGEYTPEDPSEANVFPTAVPGKGLLVSSQTEVDFGSGVSNKSAIAISLVNVGDAPLTLNDMRLSNDENGISIRNDGCRIGTTLEPVEACAMTLEWEPVRGGDIVDDIQIYHTGARGILVLPLRGSAERAVNKDSKAIVFDASMGADGLLRSIPQVSSSDVGADEPDMSSSSSSGAATATEKTVVQSRQPVDVSGILDGFAITSLAPNRAIIAGPGGSRVIFDGEETVIGGVLWNVDVRRSSVSFMTGEQQVLLLFDKSLSSVNRVSGESTSTVTQTDNDN